MAGRVFVTGASGFVGKAVVDELLSREHEVIALTHRRKIQSEDRRVKYVQGSLSDAEALDEGIRGCDAVIHLVGIIMERPSQGVTFERIHFQGTKNVIDATLRAGVKRYLHMSALGTRPDAVSEYHKTKYRAEEYVRSSGLAWTIFRPSMIHGPGGELLQMEVAWARKKAPPFLFMPYFGRGALGRGGAGKLQPVHVQDVARAFVDAIDKPQTVGEVYPLGGPEQLTWPEFHHTIAGAVVGHKRWVMALPAWFPKALTHIVPRRLLPFNRDQVIMSQEENTCDISKFVGDFGWEPRGFRKSVAQYAREL